MKTHEYLLLTLVAAMVTASYQHTKDPLVISGSVVFQRKWSDFQVSKHSHQYKVMKERITKSLQTHFEDDPVFWNVTVTQLREDHPSKQSALEGNLAAEFKLYLQSKSVTGIARLRDAIKLGKLWNIPVKKDSLYLQGLPLNSIPKDYNSWPKGLYGLPKPRTGCPGKDWKEGFRYQDSENFGNINKRSKNSHLAGNITRHGIRQEFCMHDAIQRTQHVTRQWPMGKYCIYKYGNQCPSGLHEGWIYWDDENTSLDFPNEYGGAVPYGMYDKNTLIYYCCDNRGKTTTPMLLPTGKPFFLFPFGTKQCQQVHQFKVSIEYVIFDDEDQANKDRRSVISPYGPSEDRYNTRLYYCYYQPIPCQEKDRSNPACFSHFLPSSDTGTNMMMKEANGTVVAKHIHSHRAFAIGSGIGIMLMGWTAFIVSLQRLIQVKNRPSHHIVYHY